MRRIVPLTIGTVAIAAVAVAAACNSGTSISHEFAPNGSVGAVNSYVAAVDLLVDGTLVFGAIAPGQYSTSSIPAGAHTIAVRPTGSGLTVSFPMTVVTGRTVSIAATRAAGGAFAAASLEDTNATVPAGATKLRVLHMAPLAGEVQVWRTQPDFGTPIRWQFPFLYSPTISALGNPYFQSTPGTWDVRAWTDTLAFPPGNATPWATPLDQVTVPLTGGQKKTVLILDKAGGGVKLVVID